MKQTDQPHGCFRLSNILAIIATTLALFVGLGANLVASANADVTTQSTQNRLYLTVEVAEDLAKFVSGPPLDQDGIPQRGSFFIAQGNLFPEGTIQGDGADFDPNSEGTMGTWFCRGTHLVSGLEAPEARFAVSTAQAFLLPDDKQMIVSEGLEGGVGFEVQRVVSGGTGEFRNVMGIQKQELIGFNQSGGVLLRVTFELDRVRR